jgi:hypothetical protein
MSETQYDSDSELSGEEPVTPRLGKSQQYRSHNAVFNAL